ncbi:MAG: hypothetical protein FWG70_07695 [Oscillospiraceae bacterium]|nr:hypothetical protein [Oscillospiraceae bacterium]
MIIDGRTLNLSFNPFGTKTAYLKRTGKEAATITKLINDNGKDIKIIHDYIPKSTSLNFDVFQNDLSAVNNLKSIMGNVPLMVLQMPFEQDYTANDALNNNWFASTQNKIFSINIDSGVKNNGATVKNEEVIGMDKEQFLSYIRENGLDKEINWGVVSLNFRGSSYSFESFSAYTDYTAALYASLENRIMNDFTGDEQAEQLETLNHIFENAINDMSKYYINQINTTFEAVGVNIDKNEIEQGIREVMTAKKDAYLNFVKSNTDYANLADSEDKWLERDIGFMANTLRNAFSPEVKTEGSFKENDIIAIGAIAGMFSGSGFESGMIYGLDFNDEESVGLAIAMNYLMLNATMDNFNVNDSIRELGTDIFNKYSQSVINGINKGLHVSRDGATKVGQKPEMFAPLKTDDIFAVVNTMIKTYEETKDVQKAIYETTSFAYTQFKGKEKTAENAVLWRYSAPSGRYMANGADFWDSLYDNGSGSSYMGKILEKWNTFAGAIEKNDYKNLSKWANINLFQNYRSWAVLDKSIAGG